MKKITQALPDVLLVTGCVSLSYGAGLLSTAAGFIVGGLLLVGGGVAAARQAQAGKVED